MLVPCIRFSLSLATSQLAPMLQASLGRVTNIGEGHGFLKLQIYRHLNISVFS